MKDKACVFNIQRYSIHDGPGIRTLIFFKGCPLHCKWCANPEGIRSTREVKYTKQICIGCGKCLVCPYGAVSVDSEEGFVIDRNKCKACGRCIQCCPRHAKAWYGEEYTLDELMEKIKKDKVFYESSGGGVTLGGGDPMMQSEFAEALLLRCREEGINTAMETEAYCRFDRYLACGQLCDTLFTDFKAIDPAKHSALTGVNNTIIMDNIQRMSQWIVSHDSKVDFIIRIPLLPEVNFTLDDMKRAGAFLARQEGVRSVEILPFHNLGEHKYVQIGVPYEYEGRENLKPEDVQDYAEVLRSAGVSVQITSM